MSNQDNRLVWMLLCQSLYSSANTRPHRLKAFTFRRCESHILFPVAQVLSIFWTARLYFGPAQSFPGSETNLTKIIYCLYLKVMACCYRQCGRVGTSQGATIDCCKRQDG